MLTGSTADPKKPAAQAKKPAKPPAAKAAAAGKKDAPKADTLRKGRLLKPLATSDGMDEEERRLVEFVNSRVAEGDGVSIPKSIFRDIVYKALHDVAPEGADFSDISIKPIAMGLLHCETEDYLSGLFARTTKVEQWRDTRPLQEGQLSTEMLHDYDERKLKLHYDSAFEDEDIEEDLRKEEEAELAKEAALTAAASEGKSAVFTKADKLSIAAGAKQGGKRKAPSAAKEGEVSAKDAAKQKKAKTAKQDALAAAIEQALDVSV